jgi:hypothetical protein
MSITSELRTYADNAVTQGKQAITTAQAQLNDVTGQANEFYGQANEFVTELAGKATTAVNDLRVSAEKAVNLDAIKTAVEPYLAQLKGYSTTVTDRAESLFDGVKSDPRVAKLVDAARPVVETVQARVVQPVQELTGLGAKPAPKAAAKPAATKPATAAAKPATAKPASKAAAKKPAARKAPARRATTR